MRISKGFTPITLDFDKHDLQLLVDAINFGNVSTLLTQELFNASVITQRGNKNWYVNDGKGTGSLVERPVALTLNVGKQEDFDVILDSFKAIVGSLASKEPQSRRITAEATPRIDPSMTKAHKLLSEAINRLCAINNPGALARIAHDD